MLRPSGRTCRSTGAAGAVTSAGPGLPAIDDFDDLAGFINKAPRSGNGESTNARLAAQEAAERARTRLLPDKPYELEKLRAMDADVRYQAQRINAPKWPLDRMSTHLRLQGGLLQLEPLDFGAWPFGHMHPSVVQANQPGELALAARGYVLALGELDLHLADASRGHVYLA